MKRKRFIVVIAVAASIVVSFKGVSALIAADINGYPQKNTAQLVSSIQSKNTTSETGDDELCSPISDNNTAKLMAEEEGQHGIYRMWTYQDPEQGTDIKRVSLRFGDMCATMYDSNVDEAITNRVPLTIARNLTLDAIKKIAEEQGGLEQYRQNILNSYTEMLEDDLGPHPLRPNEPSNNNEQPTITSVDLWALNEFGVILPTGTYVVNNIDDAWIYDSPQE
jgi:hypothetical protein